MNENTFDFSSEMNNPYNMFYNQDMLFTPERSLNMFIPPGFIQNPLMDYQMSLYAMYDTTFRYQNMLAMSNQQFQYAMPNQISAPKLVNLKLNDQLLGNSSKNAITVQDKKINSQKAIVEAKASLQLKTLPPLKELTKCRTCQSPIKNSNLLKNQNICQNCQRKLNSKAYFVNKFIKHKTSKTSTTEINGKNYNNKMLYYKTPITKIDITFNSKTGKSGQKTKIEKHTHAMMGKDYQACIPSFLGSGKERKKGISKLSKSILKNQIWVSTDQTKYLFRRIRKRIRSKYNSKFSFKDMHDLLFVYENNIVLVWKKITEKERDIIKLISDPSAGTRLMRSLNMKPIELIDITDGK